MFRERSSAMERLRELKAARPLPTICAMAIRSVLSRAR
jgi:hypothetical protein